ncbi:MAG: helix-turn-helix transcriptional regulator [Ignavibacteria bacterium]|nr:helix-turn-helix transcriptional regulator [Ignavibacteria bacterium]
MLLTQLYADREILKEIGKRLSRFRIQRALTQEELASRSGVSKSSIERLESGKACQLSTLIKILRELQLLDNLDKLIPEQQPTPMDYLRQIKTDRQRVTYKYSELREPTPKWEWGDKK